jgi:hypothetical protein
MSIGQNKLLQRGLIPDLMYALWLLTGSITRVARRLRAEGVYNPAAPGIFSRMGIWAACNKHSEAYKRYREARTLNGIYNGSTAPTQKELDEARVMVDTLMPEQIKRVKELEAIYGSFPEVLA